MDKYDSVIKKLESTAMQYVPKNGVVLLYGSHGYEFADDVDVNVRSAFIEYLKFPLSLKDEPNLTQFIQKAIDDLNDKIDLYYYDLVVMLQSSSKVNQYILRYIYRFSQPSLHYMGESIGCC